MPAELQTGLWAGAVLTLVPGVCITTKAALGRFLSKKRSS